jgi:hypothetical protein
MWRPIYVRVAETRALPEFGSRQRVSKATVVFYLMLHPAASHTLFNRINTSAHARLQNPR